MKKETFLNLVKAITVLVILFVVFRNFICGDINAAFGWFVAFVFYIRIITEEYVRFLKELKTELVDQNEVSEREITPVKKIISADDVMKYARENGGSRFMCKNCGSKHDALQTSRHYCEKCGCWLCPDCSGELCEECKN